MLSFVRNELIFGLILRASRNLHKKMAETVIRSKIIFFDSNPIGRIVTRFSKDVVVIDLILPPLVIFITLGVFRSLAVAISIAVINPWILIAVGVAVVLMVIIVRVGGTAMTEG